MGFGTRVVAGVGVVAVIGGLAVFATDVAGAAANRPFPSAPTPIAIDAPITTTTVEVTAPASPAATVAITPVTVDPTLAAQQRLTDLGYWLGKPDGTLGTNTKQAVLAFQKVNGLPLTSALDERTTAALATATRPTPVGYGGDRIEIDKSRQVIFVVRDGAVLYTFNTSTGTEQRYNDNGHRGVADTPTGTFAVIREVNRNDPGPLGSLYRPKYLTHDGIAVHGAASVPTTAASHGCARVTNAVMDLVWSENLMPMGSEVVISGVTPNT